jgi:predicted RND superfamily exporter protein
MSKKLQRRINGGLAIYYGMGAAITTVMGLVGFIVWIVKVVLGKVEFNWAAAILIPLLILGIGLFAYAMLRVGYEELED